MSAALVPSSSAVSHPAGDFCRDRRMLMLAGMAVLIGFFNSLVAWVLVQLIAVITNLAFFQRLSNQQLSPALNHLGGLVVLIPVIGGLLIGLMARFGSEKIRGHGIPEALEAILIGRSKMDPRVAVLKPVSSAISIGTGGPFGAEGPIIMTGGALGSLFAQLFRLSAPERKVLLVAGAASGMAAIFNSPVAAILLAIELLLFEWKPRSIVPVGIAAVVAGIMRGPLLGGGPVFPVVVHTVLPAVVVLLALLVGLIAGAASGGLTRLVYFCEDLFQRIPIHWMWYPAIGGLFVGVGALLNPQVLGVGYDVIHALLKGQLAPAAAASLMLSKATVWAIALGSGTSGGVLAPLLMIGGALGALESVVIPWGDAGLWATVSMAAMIGGTMRSPFTAIVFTLELTHDINTLPALLAACLVAYAFTVLALPRSILTEKIARRGHHVTREYATDPLELLYCREVMESGVATVMEDMLVQELADLMAQPASPLSQRHGLPIVDMNKELVGIVTRGDVLRAVAEQDSDILTVRQAGTEQLIVTYPDELLSDAVAKMVLHDIGRLPVVARQQPEKLLGVVGRSSVMKARSYLLEQESRRERTWSVGALISEPPH